MLKVEVEKSAFEDYLKEVFHARGEIQHKVDYMWSDGNLHGEVSLSTERYTYQISSVFKTEEDSYIIATYNCHREGGSRDLCDGLFGRQMWEEIKSRIIHNEMMNGSYMKALAEMGLDSDTLRDQ